MTRFVLVTVLAFSLTGLTAFGQTPAPEGQPSEKTTTDRPMKRADRADRMTPEQRKTMAKMHREMASCLESTRTLQECRQEMMSSCKKMGADGCPMMGRAKGMRRGQGMDMGGEMGRDESSK